MRLHRTLPGLAGLLLVAATVTAQAASYGPIADQYGVNAHLYKNRAVQCVDYCRGQQIECWDAVVDAYMRCRKNMQARGDFSACAQYLKTNHCDRMHAGCEGICLK